VRLRWRLEGRPQDVLRLRKRWVCLGGFSRRHGGVQDIAGDELVSLCGSAPWDIIHHPRLRACLDCRWRRAPLKSELGQSRVDRPKPLVAAKLRGCCKRLREFTSVTCWDYWVAPQDLFRSTWNLSNRICRPVHARMRQPGKI